MLLDGTGRDAEGSADVVVAEVDDVTKGEHLALAAGERTEDPGQRPPVEILDAPIGMVGEDLARSATPDHVDGQIGGHSGDPGRPVGKFGYPLPVDERPGCGLGRNVLGFVLVSEDASGHGEAEVEDLIERLLEGGIGPSIPTHASLTFGVPLWVTFRRDYSESLLVS